jgi:rhodanese-related sulfurtransferase
MRRPTDSLETDQLSRNRQQELDRPLTKEEDKNMPTIDREQLKAMLASDTPIRLIMAQGPGRYHAAHIPGSETFASLDEALDQLDVDDLIVLYCSGGHVSIQAQRWLLGQGYRNVVRYPGGLADWHDAGLPLAGDNRLRACQ